MTAETQTESPVKGAEIARLRKAKRTPKITQTELAEWSGLSHPTIQRAERSDPTVSRPTMLAIAKALGVQLAEIYDEQEAPTEAPPAWFVEYEQRHIERERHTEAAAQERHQQLLAAIRARR